jgi:cytochrome c-type biogenesis protein CcmF
MLANLGFFSVLFTLLAALFGAGASAYGSLRRRAAFVESGRHAMVLAFPLLSVSVICLELLLTQGSYQVEYVSAVTSRAMPVYLRITALWGGQPGSLLFWSWLMAAFATAASLRRWDRDRDLLPGVTLVTMGTLAFFLLLVVGFENPFARLWQTADGLVETAMFAPAGSLPFVPVDGQGLNPLLRHPGMIIHPPMLYLGFVSFVVPYAFAIASMMTGRSDDRWIRLTRRWALVAWLFLSLGLILGGRWAYDVLGWGGYWGWDPVEIAALMPWLAGTAFLHSVMIQEKRGILKHWNMVLIILTYALVIFGTFLTRSGVLSSVHAFAQSAIGPLFFAFIGLTFAASLALLLRRWGELRGENQLDSMLSREAFFLLNNLLFMGILAVCFLGVIFPLISELVTGQKVTVGAVWYERITGPLWAGLLLLMGVAPLSAYGRSSWRILGSSIWKPAVAAGVVVAALALAGMRMPGALVGYGLASLAGFVALYEFGRGAWARRLRHGENLVTALFRLAARNRRRYGGYVIHLGVVLMAFGVIGIENFQTQTQGTLSQGEALTMGRYSLVYESLAEFDTPDGRNVARAVVSVYRDGDFLGELYPRRDYFYESEQPMSIPGVRSSLEDDVYILLVSWEPVGVGAATFKVYRNPLVNFVWWGGLVFILGTLVAAWPEREALPLAVARRQRPAFAGGRLR